MKNNLFIIIFMLFATQMYAQKQGAKSPNGSLQLTFELSAEGEAFYSLNFKEKTVLKPSKMVFELKDQKPLKSGFKITKTNTKSVRDSWNPVWGEVKTIQNHYEELEIGLEDADNRLVTIRFRVFDDGLGFRYEFPIQTKFKHFVVTDERTEFNLAGDHTAFWIPGDYDTNEYAYTTSPLSKVNAFVGKTITEISTRSLIAENAVQTPLMLKTQDGLYINIHEAALVNYSAMNLLVDRKTFSLSSQLVPNTVGDKAYLQTPATTPWRTIIVSDKATDIIASKMVLNLNEPSKITDTSWIKPQKMIGVWWEMHVDKSRWDYTSEPYLDFTSDLTKLKPHGKHGATTENTKKHIDFAAKHGIESVLVEGWNVGWEDWFGAWKEEVFDFVTPYPDFDVAEVNRYAASKGVKLIMHHETSGSVTNYERRMDEAYQFMKKYGYDAVKTGYVGKIIPRGEHHDGQWMVNHYVRAAQKMADYKIMLDAHEPVRPTGLHRTYPNWLACEAARGNEFNAWSSGNPPEHETILPFTRLIGGPMDYTPGIFQIKRNYYQNDRKEQVHTTLVKQLALYVTMYSPLQMAADLPENYEKHLDAFQFIKDVAVDWDDTKVLEAEPADYLTIARKGKNTENWFIGAITDENPRKTQIKLDFLNPNTQYVATIYADAADAHWEKNPMAYQISHVLVNQKTVLKLSMANGGGVAVSFRPAQAEELKKLKAYK